MNRIFKKGSSYKQTWQSSNVVMKNEIEFAIADRTSTIKDITVINKVNLESDLLNSKLQTKNLMIKLRVKKCFLQRKYLKI